MREHDFNYEKQLGEVMTKQEKLREALKAATDTNDRHNLQYDLYLASVEADALLGLQDGSISDDPDDEVAATDWHYDQIERNKENQ
jgi:hypothetical protein